MGSLSMSFKFPRKYYIVFAIIALTTAVVIYWASSHIVRQEENARLERLERVNSEAATAFKESLNTYATLLSGIKAFIELHNRTPDRDLIQRFIRHQLEGLSITPPFSISYVNSDHVIQFDITLEGEDSLALEGKSMRQFVGEEGIQRMDMLKQKSAFYVSSPTNLLEGGVGLPLGFGVINDENQPIGYITTITELAPIIERIYANINKEEFTFRFQTSDGVYFDHTRSYNDQATYEMKNEEYSENSHIPPEAYIASSISFYNKEFTITSAYKSRFKNSPTIFVASIILYLTIIGFMLFLISQYYIYEKKNTIINGQKRQLSELVATKNKFFSIIAHDLRSPLSSIINFLDLLKDEHFKSPQTNAIIDSLENSSKNSISLLDNLLKWSTVQTGKIKFKPVALDMQSIVKDQISIHAEALSNKGLNVRLESSFKGQLEGDKNMIATVIRNLLSNAIHFSYDNDIIVIELSEEEGHFMCSIEDNGIGMTSEFKSKLLDVTQMATQEGTRNERGSGLGLILCDQFIKAHQGTLQIESQKDNGTIVYFTIPLDR